MSGDALPFSLTGRTLITGPSNVGKTRLTARALTAWIDREGTDGVVVLEFGPAYEHEGRVLGRPLSNFVEIPETVFLGALDARAPRAEGDTEGESTRLARENAYRAVDIIQQAPADPSAVFVNDATIPFQHQAGNPRVLQRYCAPATVVVLNAFDSHELGSGDPVSRQERGALEDFEQWADRVVRLGEDDG
ncbi:MAG: hypothetical protein ABEI31_03285 [Halodesulfurarchaeum sp.]